ncbi:hypothetical protein SAMN05442782_1781 [Streptomyces sp. OK228]|nr:hypothetical protein SAMN05442782_1781 [Streptomyces sp. OK228]
MAFGGGGRTIGGWPAAGTGGVMSDLGSFGGGLLEQRGVEVDQAGLLHHRDVVQDGVVAWSARARTSVFFVVERIFATVLKIRTVRLAKFIRPGKRVHERGTGRARDDGTRRLRCKTVSYVELSR